ncbi:MAG: hypothetical protein KJ062_12890 [Thermoanaerobaculia bacterium]|nr:hypothetical protein [Thermoanaerobaculia bacterium]
MRTTWILLACCGLAARASALSPPLDLGSVRAAALEDAATARLRADLAERRRQLAATGGFAREGPVVGVEAGPRRLEDDGTKADLSVEADVPIRLRGGARATAVATLDEAAPVLLAAVEAEAGRSLAEAYAEAWLAASRVEALAGQRALLEAWRDVARKRVEAGADAPFQATLVEADLLRARGDLDRARREAAEAWGALRALADLPEAPQALASPAIPVWPGADESRARFEAGVARASIDARLALDLAFGALESSDRLERWSLLGSVAKEGVDSVARAGLAYRFPLPGERTSGDEASRSYALARRREADAERRLLEARLAGALERAREFGPLPDGRAFEEALAAVNLRVLEGKDSPSDAVLSRRALLEGRLAALEKLRDASVLSAELDALTKGMTP